MITHTGVNLEKQAFRLLDGRPSVLKSSDLIVHVPFEDSERFVDTLVDKILQVRPDWNRESLIVQEAARRYTEFAAKFQEGDDIFFFELTRQKGLVLIRPVDDEPRIVTVLMTQYT